MPTLNFSDSKPVEESTEIKPVEKVEEKKPTVAEEALSTITDGVVVAGMYLLKGLKITGDTFKKSYDKYNKKKDEPASGEK